MKNLVKKACVIASALMIGGVSTASTVYQGKSIPRDDIEYDEEEDFEPRFGDRTYKSENSSSDLGGIIALVVIPCLIYMVVIRIGENRNFRDDNPQKTIYFRKQSLIREMRNSLEVSIVKTDIPKYQIIESESLEGNKCKCLYKFMACGGSGYYIPVKYAKQPKEYNLSQCDYNFLIWASILGFNKPEIYREFLKDDSEFPSVEEIEDAKNMIKDNESAAPVIENQ